jgi:SAM-dependent methyltransferase
MSYIAGFCLHNDYSEREFQLERGGQWVKGKSCDTFAPLGPFLATIDEVGDPQKLDLWLKLNGELLQDSNTDDMIFDIPLIVSYLSQFMTLLPGDVISTGTPAGVGLGFKPPRYLKAGDVVGDLGSGAGNDCFIAREEVGETGKVIGIDFTPAMIEKATVNAKKLGFTNVHFLQGDIEEMPVESNVADVVVSNCVLNLVPDKEGVIKEIYRVLKPGGHFSISDIVLIGELPENLRKSAEMYAGCVSGAIQKNEYLEFISAVGFNNISI